MKTSLKYILVAFFISLVSSSLQAQKTMGELAYESDEDLLSNAYFGSDELKKFDKESVRPLRKIGLLTFVLKDYKFKKGEKADVYAYKPDGTANYFASKILKSAQSEIKSKVAEHGVELLFAEDYLANDEVKAAYDQGFEKYLEEVRGDDFVSVISKNPSLPVSAMGYNGYFPADGGRHDETIEIYGDLCDKLGVDALMTITINTQTTSNSLLLEEIRMTLHAKRLNPGKRDLGGVHLGTYTFVTRQWIPFVGLKKGEVTGESYKGFASVLSRLSSEFVKIIGTEFEIIP